MKRVFLILGALFALLGAAHAGLPVAAATNSLAYRHACRVEILSKLQAEWTQEAQKRAVARFAALTTLATGGDARKDAYTLDASYDEICANAGLLAQTVGGQGLTNLVRGGVILVAASDSDGKRKAAADYICPSSSAQTKLSSIISGASAGAKVVLLAGTYNTSGKIVTDRSYIDIEGESHPFWGGYNGHGWQNTGNPVAAEGTAGTKIKASGDYNLISIDGVNFPDGGENRHRAIRIAKLYLFGSSYTGTGVGGGTNDDRVVVEDVMVHRCNKGIDLWTDSVLINNCNIQDNAGDAITNKGGGQITSCLVWDNGGSSLVLNTPNTMLVTGNMLQGPAATVNVQLNTCTNCTVVGNRIAKGATIVGINGGSGNVISGNTIEADVNAVGGGVVIGNTTASTSGVLQGNLITNAGSVTSYAIDINLTSTGWTVTGNTVAGGGWRSGASGENPTVRWGGGAKFLGNTGTGEEFDPRVIMGGALVGMYDASDLRTLFQDSAKTTAVTTNGQSVGCWADLSGNIMDLLQATSGTRPTYASAGFNSSKPCVSFNGSAWIAAADNAAIKKDVQAMMFGIKMDVDVSSRVIFCYPHAATHTSPYFRWALYCNSKTSIGPSTNGSGLAVTGLTDIFTTPCIMTCDSYTQNLYQGRTYKGTGGTTSVITYPNATGLRLAANGGGTETFVGSYPVFLVFSEQPSPTQWGLLYRWCQRKTGLGSDDVWFCVIVLVAAGRVRRKIRARNNRAYSV